MSSLSLDADKEFEVFAYRLVLAALWFTVVGCVSGGHKGKSDLAETSESHDVADASADHEVVNTDVSVEDSSDGTSATDTLEDTAPQP